MNALVLIVVTKSGSVIDVNAEQLSNARLLIILTKFGIMIDVNAEQL